MNLKNILVLPLLLSLSSFTTAEVFRWVDDKGKVHYGDRKPKQSTAEDISSKVSKNNVDESSKETRKLEKIFAVETPAEKQLKQQRLAEQRNKQKKRQIACKKASSRLETLKGRVYFIDKEGKAYDVSEQERQQRVVKLQNQIDKYCH